MFKPRRVIFEEKALDYELGENLLKEFQEKDVEIMYSKNGRITGIPGKTSNEMYFQGKNTLVVGVRKDLKFQSCKPSANYQLPIVSGCMGMCEYCYLNTQMGKKPYIKIHTNIEEILERAKEYIEERRPEVTVFEGAATSDPIPVEYYSRALKYSIEFFGKNDLGRFRFVTKFTDVDNLLGLQHNNKTTIRFSINTDRVISLYEHKTPPLNERINAAYKVSQSNYNIGFIIAPVFLYEGWEKDYENLIDVIGSKFHNRKVSFEVISHRFTKRAKENILGVFPKTLLPMEEEIRKFKYGQFGYGKYVYEDKQLSNMKDFFKTKIKKYFSEDNIKYII